MTREEAKDLKIFQIVKWNEVKENVQDEEHKWLIPFCGKLAIVSQKIIWDDGGEEIHLKFPKKIFYDDDSLYDNIDELMQDWKNGHDFDFNIGFDTSAEYIDIIEY